MTRDDAARMLREVLEATKDFDDEDRRFDHNARQVFDGWLSRMDRWPSAELSERQAKWLAGVHERVCDSPKYENAWSAGKVPMGRPVATPAVLTNLPKRTPQRRTEGT